MGIYQIDCPECKMPFFWFSGNLFQLCPECTNKRSTEMTIEDKLAKALAYKENTFLKQVERTAKRDAYALAYEQIKHTTESKQDVLLYLASKRDSHTEYLDKLPFEYDYATQTLVPKRSYTITITESPNGTDPGSDHPL